MDRWYGEEYDRLSEMLDDLQRAHAHELAEKIRAEITRTSRPGYPSGSAWQAADLIDPYTT
ncbi:hypothetical protein [Streptomyces sp. CB03911]|uniref:hypothetical protein n=1 Tax=Streptomyces sp. CB03911 TaxID=1804758 RepID=UPI00093A630A|nr:hypothetical protein [Streptomyces sp. CB03911]OKI19289.1 hypothetical protein A6A07_07245 [Streptomyces sp. CB03911]